MITPLDDGPDPAKVILTIPDAAAEVEVTVRTVNRWIAAGRLPLLPGRRVRLADVWAVESACWRASRRGRPGARPRIPA